MGLRSGVHMFMFMAKGGMARLIGPAEPCPPISYIQRASSSTDILHPAARAAAPMKIYGGRTWIQKRPLSTIKVSFLLLEGHDVL